MKLSRSFILLLLPALTFAQSLKVHMHSNDKKLLHLAEATEGLYRDSVDLHQKLMLLKTRLYARGYLFSHARIEKQDSITIANIEPGRKIYLNQFELITPDNLVLPVLEPSKSKDELTGLEDRIGQYLTTLENNGYPFAGIDISHYDLQNDTLYTTLRITPGPMITIDSLVVKGFNNFPKSLMRYDLRFRKGMPYSEAYVHNLPQKIEQVEYLNSTRPPAVAFSRDKTVLYLYLEEVKSNQIDGVIGLNTDENGKVTLNGDFQLRLLNALHHGEEFNIRWRRPDQSIQSLNFSTTIPYLFKTPFWLQGNLFILKQDSSYVNSQAEGYLKYLLETGSFLSGGIEYRSSNVLNSASDAASVLKSFNTTFYKLGLELTKTNRAIVPTAGYSVVAYGTEGTRKTSANSQKEYGWDLELAKYIRLFSKRHILKTGFTSQALFGKSLFQNELYRIGGLKSLRGFNEQSIYASSYGIGAAEYRYMIGKYDFLAAFANVAYVENKSGENFSTNIFTGLGAGINFQTGSGLFSLFFAVGRDNANPWDLRTSKIHFGYVNRF